MTIIIRIIVERGLPFFSSLRLALPSDLVLFIVAWTTSFLLLVMDPQWHWEARLAMEV
jgi:hypothetical protein